jgi:hypothetical protein
VRASLRISAQMGGILQDEVAQRLVNLRDCHRD